MSVLGMENLFACECTKGKLPHQNEGEVMNQETLLNYCVHYFTLD